MSEATGALLFRRLMVLGARHAAHLEPDKADAYLDQDIRRLDPSADRAFCKVLGLMLSRRGPDPIAHLTALSRYSDERLTGRAHVCGHRLFAVTVRIPLLGQYARDRWFCERCGVVAETPHAVTPPDFLPSSQLALAGGPWDEAWAVGAVAPLGAAATASSPPRRVRIRMLDWPVPALGHGHKFRLGLVNAGEHMVLEWPLPLVSCKKG